MTNSVLVCNKCQNEFAIDARVQQLPPVSHVLLRLNTLPSHTELRQEHSYLEREERELRRYNQEITRLQQALGQLEVQRRALLERMECRRSWIAPIRRLPAEVLEEIFDIVCQPYSLEISFYQKPGERARTMILSHVSYQWRRIVGRCARLWSRICINVEASNDRSIKILLGLYLTNSAEYPLVFELVGDVDSTRSRTCYQSVIAKISPHCKRLQRFVLNIDNKHGRMYTRAREDLTLPSSLRYFEHSGELEGTAEWFSKALRGAPKLTTVKCSNFVSKDLLPYHQLTTLEVEDLEAVKYKDLVEVLGHCTSLRSLKIGFSCHGFNRDGLDAGSYMHSNFTLPCLDHLSISNPTRYSFLTIILRQLTLPSLKTVSLRATLSSNPATHESRLQPVSDLIRRSGCQLIEISIDSYGSFPSQTEFLHVFELSPELERIRLRFRDGYKKGHRKGSQTFMYKLLEVLQGSPHGILVPDLVRIQMSEEGSSVDPDSAFAFLDMIESRNAYRGVDRMVLWDFDLAFSDLWECSAEVIAAFEARLEDLAQDGIRCSVKWAKPFQAEEDVNLNSYCPSTCSGMSVFPVVY
ncbi:hypothetical protein VNI00_010054 [Paramarasmius palmivorus]|uniref:F-box domain-containing protein n=1 Tax=Paramarasmius palmivorus TaxID=297713 RepID=A0AAW0CJM9_9AGAR